MGKFLYGICRCAAGNQQASVDANVKETSYWIYSPGDNASMWDEFYKLGIMGIGWDEVGNLKDFSSKEEIKEKMKSIYGTGHSYKNDAHCLWQFANEIKVGDVIFAKKRYAQNYWERGSYF